MSSRKSAGTKTLPGAATASKAAPATPMAVASASSPATGSPAPTSATTGEDLSTYTTFPPCGHLSKVLSSSARDMVLKTYTTGMKICLLTRASVPEDAAYRTRDGSKVHHQSLVSLKSKILRCKECHTGASIFMCLQCPNVGCLKHSHALSHAKSSGHIFGIDPKSGRFICFKCRDFVSDPRLERIRVAQIKKAGATALFPGLPVFEHEHDRSKQQLILSDSRLPTYKASTGLKGFVNMGSTCFMSSILQTLVHNPFIRDYFLAGSHIDCPRSAGECLSCCIQEIFQDFYTSSSTAGFGPVSLLTASWKVKRSLAGYTEQDAHEFWQFLLHQLHKGDTNRCGGVFCDCITHRTFSGELQSSLTCLDCRQVRVTVDPMLDLSLEIQRKLPNNARSYIPSLAECLDKFTHPEKLDTTYSCSTCGRSTPVTKQLKIKSLPTTLGIQLKRFEHLATSTKIDAHVDIPLILDMSPYTLVENPAPGKNLYELFAVVCHIGSVNTGHYVCMVKNRDGIWFRFDDTKVTRVSQGDVLSSKAYLLYYIIHELP